MTPRTLTVDVTPDRIRRGPPRSAAFGPISLALAEDYRVTAKVGRLSVSIRGPGLTPHPIGADLPEVARRFVADHDAGLPVGPIRFALQWPPTGAA